MKKKIVATSRNIADWLAKSKKINFVRVTGGEVEFVEPTPEPTPEPTHPIPVRARTLEELHIPHKVAEKLMDYCIYDEDDIKKYIEEKGSITSIKSIGKVAEQKILEALNG